jgi:hypothetical protein
MVEIWQKKWREIGDMEDRWKEGKMERWWRGGGMTLFTLEKQKTKS